MVSVPLSGVFALQVLLVIAAFTAVVTVLSTQQRNEFEDSLTARLTLQQKASFEGIVNPLFDRRSTFDNFVYSYVNGKNGDGVFIAPADEPNMTNLERGQNFYDHFYIMPHRDSMVRLVSIANLSNRVWAPYQTRRTPEEIAAGVIMPSTGERRTPRTWHLSYNYTYNLWGVDFNKLAVTYEEWGTACVGLSGYPAIRYPCTAPAMQLGQPFNSAHGIVPPWELQNGVAWGTLGIYADQLTSLNHEVLSLFRPMKVNGHLLAFGISFAIPHIKPLIAANTAHSSSRAALFQQLYRHELRAVEHLMIAGKVDFPDWDHEMIAVTGAQRDGVWEAGKTPDPILNAAYALVRDAVPNQTAGEVVDMEYGDVKYLVSVSRYVLHEANMNWLYVEYTPRSVFFDESDRARLAGILIGVFGALVVLIACVGIWFAVRLPLVKLAQNMELAANLRSDEVEDDDSGSSVALLRGPPMLSEIGDVSKAFKEMNAKLMAAIPFLPQHLRVRLSDGSGDEDEENDGGEEDGEMDDDGLPKSTHGDGGVSAGGVSISGTDMTVSTSYRNYNHRAGGGGSRHSDSAPSSTFPDRRAAQPAPSGHHQAPQMEIRRVGVLVVNVINFHTVLLSNTLNVSNLCASSATSVHKLHGALARIVEQCAAEERGVVDFFHGDRFVVGFNTARMCGNSSRNGAEAAAKIWERFLAHPILPKAFPQGLSMGLGVGRAAIGNHGTDSMQRLATMGPVYTEAIRLQEAMSRCVLMTTTTTTSAAAVEGTHSTCMGPSLTANPLIAGRCLIMGRTVQEVEMSANAASAAAHCQLLGGIPCATFLPATARAKADYLAQYARVRNNDVMRPTDAMTAAAMTNHNNSPNSAVGATNQHHLNLAGTAMGPPLPPQSVDDLLVKASTRVASSTSPQQQTQTAAASVLVAVVVSRKAAATRAHAEHNYTNTTPTRSKHTVAANNNNKKKPSAAATRSPPLLSNVAIPYMDMAVINTTAMRADDGDTVTEEDPINDDDEWLYQMRDEAKKNPYAEANGWLYNLWVHGALPAEKAAVTATQSDADQVFNTVTTPTGADAVAANNTNPSDPLHVSHAWPLHVCAVLQSSGGSPAAAMARLTYGGAAVMV